MRSRASAVGARRSNASRRNCVRALRRRFDIAPRRLAARTLPLRATCGTPACQLCAVSLTGTPGVAFVARESRVTRDRLLYEPLSDSDYGSIR
jgi:hypothetical protein